ncbi:MAG: anaerobic ribonucleoside-triphosphate reductase activating protein [Candidatus ainarchaeum sp.]|nr:anaerobic ribonucleoside-triphosphate reductase activating protein [Candidatus ainarchaeum sp.]
MPLVFKGLQKTTLIDFPGQIACTFFLPKCNFKCGFCYNPNLVFDEETGTRISEKEALAFLDERKNFLDGVCISGGEPTLHPGLPEFCAKIKEKGLLVKLDTNGSNPEMLKSLIEKNLVDFVAMDIKASKEKYSLVCGAKIDLEKISESIGLIRKSGIDYEFRATVVPLLEEKDLLEIGEWLKGSKKFVLQQFHNEMPLLGKNLQKLSPYSPEQLKKFAEKLKPFFGKIEVRGI